RVLAGLRYEFDALPPPAAAAPAPTVPPAAPTAASPPAGSPTPTSLFDQIISLHGRGLLQSQWCRRNRIRHQRDTHGDGSGATQDIPKHPATINSLHRWLLLRVSHRSPAAA